VLELGSNSEESPAQPLQLALSFFIAELATIHLQEMAGSRQRLAGPGKVGMDDTFGN